MHTQPIISVDLRDAPYLPIDVQALTTTRAWLLARSNPAIAFALVNLMLCARHEVPAGSIPDDDKLLPLMAGVNARAWKAIRDNVLAEFDLCSDGRFYHQAVVKQVEAEAAAHEKKLQRSETYSRNGRKSGESRAARSAAQAAIASAAAPAAVTAHLEPAKQATAAKPAADKASVVLPAADPRQLSLIDADAGESVIVADEVVTRANAAIAIAPAAGFKSVVKGPTADEINKVFKHWLLVHKKRAQLSPKRRTKIKLALERYPMEEVLAAIDGCRMSKYHMAEDREGPLYNDIELILRDSEHIEKFREIATGEGNAGAPARVVSAGTKKALDDFDEYVRSKNRAGGVQGELT